MTLSFSSLLNKKPCVRIKRKKIVTTTKTPNNYLVVTRLIPWIRIGKNYAWMGSLATAKGRRQINDWLARKTRRKSVQYLDNNLTGRDGNLVQAIIIRQVYKWFQLIPEGDMILFHCESTDPERQMRVWSKWIRRHNWDIPFDIDENTKTFYIWKPYGLE